MIARMSCGKLSVGGGSRVQNTKRLVTVTEFDESAFAVFVHRDVLHPTPLGSRNLQDLAQKRERAHMGNTTRRCTPTFGKSPDREGGRKGGTEGGRDHWRDRGWRWTNHFTCQRRRRLLAFTRQWTRFHNQNSNTVKRVSENIFSASSA